MRYLKLYEDFSPGKFKIKDLLEDIAALDYILSDEGIKVKYFVTEKMASDAPNRYMIGTSDDISTKIDDSFEDVGIYKMQIYFNTKPNQEEALEEYFNKLKEHIEDVYDVNVLKEGTRPSYEWNLVDGSVKSTVYENENCVTVIVERQPDDYIYFEDEDEDINESVDDDTAMKHYGIYPEDIFDMFYDLQNPAIFPEMLSVTVEFKSKLGMNANLRMDNHMTDKKFTFQHFPFIEVRVKTQQDYSDFHHIYTNRVLERIKEDARFKEVIEVANERLEDYGWKIEKTNKSLSNDYIQIIIEKI